MPSSCHQSEYCGAQRQALADRSVAILEYIWLEQWRFNFTGITVVVGHVKTVQATFYSIIA